MRNENVLTNSITAEQEKVTNFVGKDKEDITMTKLFSITFHANPKKRVHPYWFTDAEKAQGFLNALKQNPDVLDYRAFMTFADMCDSFSSDCDAVPMLQME